MEEFQFLKQYLSIESSELFFVPEMIRAEQLKGQKETDYKKTEHEKYKRVYEKYESQLYRICKENTEKVTIGLFGDDMQSIYDEGIDDLDIYINGGMLVPILKQDNFRCSYEVLGVIKSLRLDGLSQNVALKKLDNGIYEKEADRHGFVKVMYSLVDSKPSAFSSSEEKRKYQSIIKEEFEDYESRWKKERFITEFFSDELKFSEVLNYTRYLNEETEYITMHKTKGTSIPSVIVVMEEYFWNEYDFSLIYSQSIEGKSKKRNDSQKLIYVACSRAKNNLICIRVLVKDELNDFLKVFPNAELLKSYTEKGDCI